MSSPAQRLKVTAGHLSASPLAMSPTAGDVGKLTLWDATPAPNPRLVRLFMAEKGITNSIDVVQVNLGKVI